MDLLGVAAVHDGGALLGTRAFITTALEGGFWRCSFWLTE